MFLFWPATHSILLILAREQKSFPTYDLNEFAKIVGPKLIKCKFGCNFNKIILIISMQMKIIEEIEFKFFDDEKDTQELFKHLNIN